MCSGYARRHHPAGREHTRLGWLRQQFSYLSGVMLDRLEAGSSLLYHRTFSNGRDAEVWRMKLHSLRRRTVERRYFPLYLHIYWPDNKLTGPEYVNDDRIFSPSVSRCHPLRGWVSSWEQPPTNLFRKVICSLSRDSSSSWYP